MAKDSKIEWTHHTFNPWIGCTKVSPACDHCYAEGIATRFKHAEWGPDAERHITSAENWKHPLTWNRKACDLGERHRVFCASMCDVFEDRHELQPHRERLWKLIEATPNLDWLLLTKRISKVGAFVPWGDTWPENVWLGTTVENQQWADVRLPELIKHPAVVRFVSMEPLFGMIDLSRYIADIDWVIVGGESGARSRPSDIDAVRSVRDQVNAAGKAFFFKQWGNYAQVDGNGDQLVRLLKKGFRILDGREWDEFPTPRNLSALPSVVVEEVVIEEGPTEPQTLHIQVGGLMLELAPATNQNGVVINVRKVG